jgi:S-(hydroxymethyl)glutathione dehydrogenase/alcohol dehydrogenase
MKTLGAIAWRPGAPWTIEEIEIDEPRAGEVLVQWAAAGLCHSDEHFRSGDRVPPQLADELFPMLGGHEGAGTVIGAGPGVTALQAGDHVVASFAPVCGQCRYCASGRGNLCSANKDFMARGQLADGSVRHRVNGKPLYIMAKLGTFAKHSVVSERSVVKIDRDVSLQAACLVSCGVATGFGSATERAGTRPGDVVAVVGLGGLGAAAVQGARLAGARAIVAIDPFELRRSMALKFGAAHVAPSISEAAPVIEHLTDGQGADRVILTPSVVTGEIIRDGLAITGKGAVCVVTGMGPLGYSPVPLDIGAFALYAKELRGCLFGSFDPRLAPPYLLSLYRAGLLDIDAMITTYSLRDIGRALDDSLSGRNVRAVITMPAR